MREDRGTTTPEDAGRHEAHRGMADDPRPSLGEAERDECEHLHQHDVADLDGWPSWQATARCCRDCGAVCDER